MVKLICHVEAFELPYKSKIEQFMEMKSIHMFKMKLILLETQPTDCDLARVPCVKDVFVTADYVDMNL